MFENYEFLQKAMNELNYDKIKEFLPQLKLSPSRLKPGEYVFLIQFLASHNQLDIFLTLLQLDYVPSDELLEEAINHACAYYFGDVLHLSIDRNLLDSLVSDLCGINITHLYTEENNAKYKAHLNSFRGTLKVNGALVNLELWNPGFFLPLRIRHLFEILIQTQVNQIEIAQLPSPSVAGYKQLLEKLKLELKAELMTLINYVEHREAKRFIHDEEVSVKMVEALVVRFVQQVIRLVNKEECILVVCLTQQTHHVFYIALKRYDNEVEIRIDNLEYGSDRHQSIDNGKKIYPYIQNRIQYNQIDSSKKNALYSYLNNLVQLNLGFYTDLVSEKDSFDLLYDRQGLSPLTFSFNVPYPASKKQTAANCVLHNHDVGLQIRLGNQIYDWWQKKENILLDRFLPERIESNIVSWKTGAPLPLPDRIAHRLKNKYAALCQSIESINLYEGFKINSAFIHLSEENILVKINKDILDLEDENVMSGNYYKNAENEHEESRFFKNNEIKLDDLLKKNPEEIGQILIEGPPGIGKSTLCLNILEQWQKGNINKKFHACILVKLRTLRSYSEKRSGLHYTLTEIIFNEIQMGQEFYHLTEWEKEQLKEALKNNNLLLLIDGYDEVEPILKIRRDLNDAIEELIQYPYYILTSRPAINHSHLFTKRLMLNGLNTSNMMEYVSKFFKHSASIMEGPTRELVYYLKNNSQIREMARVPFYLELLCIIWQYQYQKKSSSNYENSNALTDKILSATGLYIELLKVSLIQQQKKYPDAYGLQEENIFDKVNYKVMLRVIQECAYVALTQQEYHVSPSVLESVLEKKENQDISEAELHLNLKQFYLIKQNEVTQVGDKKKYYYDFPHLTIQEFLAARHWASLFLSENKNDAKNFFYEKQYNPFFSQMWQFVSGLLESAEAIEEFFCCFQENDVLGLANLLLQLRCLGESVGDSLTNKQEQIAENASRWFESSFLFEETEQLSIRSQLFSRLRHSPNLIKVSNIQDVLLNSLVSPKEHSFRGRILYLIAEIGGIAIGKLVPYLEEVIKKDGMLYQSADPKFLSARLLAKIAVYSGEGSVKELVRIFTSSSSPQLLKYAMIYALSAFGTDPNTPAPILKLPIDSAINEEETPSSSEANQALELCKSLYEKSFRNSIVHQVVREIRKNKNSFFSAMPSEEEILCSFIYTYYTYNSTMLAEEGGEMDFFPDTAIKFVEEFTYPHIKTPEAIDNLFEDKKNSDNEKALLASGQQLAKILAIHPALLDKAIEYVTSEYWQLRVIGIRSLQDSFLKYPQILPLIEEKTINEHSSVKFISALNCCVFNHSKLFSYLQDFLPTLDEETLKRTSSYILRMMKAVINSNNKGYGDEEDEDEDEEKLYAYSNINLDIYNFITSEILQNMAMHSKEIKDLLWFSFKSWINIHEIYDFKNIFTLLSDNNIKIQEFSAIILLKMEHVNADVALKNLLKINYPAIHWEELEKIYNSKSIDALILELIQELANIIVADSNSSQPLIESLMIFLQDFSKVAPDVIFLSLFRIPALQKKILLYFSDKDIGLLITTYETLFDTMNKESFPKNLLCNAMLILSRSCNKLMLSNISLDKIRNYLKLFIDKIEEIMSNKKNEDKARDVLSYFSGIDKEHVFSSMLNKYKNSNHFLTKKLIVIFIFNCKHFISIDLTIRIELLIDFIKHVPLSESNMLRENLSWKFLSESNIQLNTDLLLDAYIETSSLILLDALHELNKNTSRPGFICAVIDKINTREISAAEVDRWRPKNKTRASLNYNAKELVQILRYYDLTDYLEQLQIGEDLIAHYNILLTSTPLSSLVEKYILSPTKNIAACLLMKALTSGKPIIFLSSSPNLKILREIATEFLCLKNINLVSQNNDLSSNSTISSSFFNTIRSAFNGGRAALTRQSFIFK